MGKACKRAAEPADFGELNQILDWFAMNIQAECWAALQDTGVLAAGAHVTA